MCVLGTFLAVTPFLRCHVVRGKTVQDSDSTDKSGDGWKKGRWHVPNHAGKPRDDKKNALVGGRSVLPPNRAHHLCSSHIGRYQHDHCWNGWGRQLFSVRRLKRHGSAAWAWAGGPPLHLTPRCSSTQLPHPASLCTAPHPQTHHRRHWDWRCLDETQLPKTKDVPWIGHAHRNAQKSDSSHCTPCRGHGVYAELRRVHENHNLYDHALGGKEVMGGWDTRRDSGTSSGHPMEHQRTIAALDGRRDGRTDGGETFVLISLQLSSRVVWSPTKTI